MKDSARGVLIYIDKLLQGNFTGKLEIECNQGGVKWVNVSSTYHARDLPEIPENLTKSNVDNTLTK